jgi:hypothetical protein
VRAIRIPKLELEIPHQPRPFAPRRGDDFIQAGKVFAAERVEGALVDDVSKRRTNPRGDTVGVGLVDNVRADAQNVEVLRFFPIRRANVSVGVPPRLPE